MRQSKNAARAIVAVICSGAVASAPAMAAVTHQVIAASGTAAPGGGTYLSFQNSPTANASGQVVYRASLPGAGASGLFLYDGSTNVPLVRTGGAAPIPPGGSYASLSAFLSPQQLNASGQFAYAAGISGGSSSIGVFLRDGATTTPVALQGTPAPTPPGGTIDFVQIDRVRLNAHGDVAYISTVAGIGNPFTHLFLHDGTTSTALAQAGASAPGGGTFSFFGNLSLNDSGHVAYFANITGGSGGSGIFLHNGAGNVALAVQGAPAPGGGNHGEVFNSPFLAINAAGQVAFDSTGRLLLNDGLTTSLIARSGDITPDGLTYSFIAPGYSLNAHGEIAFTTGLSGSGFTRGIYHFNGASTSNIALAQSFGTGGSPAPGTSGTFRDLDFARINDAGQIAFHGSLFQSSGITSANDEGIWYGSGAGLSLLAREGDSFSVNGLARTLAGNSVPSVLTDSGLAWLARFTDGTQAVMFSIFEDPVGTSPQNPLMPTATGPDGEFIFTIGEDDLAVGGDGLWIDPVVATGYRYTITGGEFIGVAPPPDPTVVDDDDNSYLLSSVNGDFLLDPTLAFPASEHDFVANGGAVTEFTIRGISVAGAGLDPFDPLAFPSFIRVNLTSPTATITMVAIPEPSSAVLMAIATAVFGVICRAARRSREP